jgi:lipopolysaccharide transport system ATP-binding protein
MSSEILIQTKAVAKKFSYSLKSSMKYGLVDIACDFIGSSTRSDRLRKNEFWSLQDINFEIRRGECLGLIGPNGSGKSTLLKMINGIIAPDRGSIAIRGRVGALIEVGAGFHPLLTGRENIYINGSIMGLKKKEIDEKFDSILNFADLGDFIDTPVGYYSSGMHVRLGFAVAAHLEPDIMLIDEVLAVGDVGFRAKCYHAIGNLLQKSAVIFVSHSMPLVAKVAQKTMVLNKGKMAFNGPTSESILKYYHLFADKEDDMRMGSGDAVINSYFFDAPHYQDKCLIEYGGKLTIRLNISAHKMIKDLIVNIVFRSIADDVIAECNNHIEPFHISMKKGGKKKLKITIEQFTLNPGVYKVALALMSKDMVVHYDWIRTSIRVEVAGKRIATAWQQFKADWEIL